MAERTCTVDGCTANHRARGLCSTHYNRQRYTADERHHKIQVPCGYCGADTTKDSGNARKYSATFCSFICRDLWRIETDTNPMPSVRSAGRPTYPRSPLPDGHPALWIGDSSPLAYGECDICAATFVKRYGRVRCTSKRCRNRAQEVRRRGRKKLRRVDVFERDAWTCWLCGLTIPPDLIVPHPRAATVDHVTPRHHGGDDSMENLAAAHFICNVRRGVGDPQTSIA